MTAANLLPQGQHPKIERRRAIEQSSAGYASAGQSICRPGSPGPRSISPAAFDRTVRAVHPPVHRHVATCQPEPVDRSLSGVDDQHLCDMVGCVERKLLSRLVSGGDNLQHKRGGGQVQLIRTG